jgi:hypothetical protein
MGTNPFTVLGLGGSAFCLNAWNWMTQNKIYASLMIFFLSNFIENQLISTGAFEVYFNGKAKVYLLVPVAYLIEMK